MTTDNSAKGSEASIPDNPGSICQSEQKMDTNSMLSSVHKTVADAVHAYNIGRLSWIWFDLLTKLPDIGVYGFISRFEVTLP
jgi:hypothetical protein